MESLLQEHFELQSPQIEKLNGYDNINYLVKDPTANYIFKTYPYSEELLAIIKAENEVLLHLQELAEDKFPKPFSFKNGEFVQVVTIAGTKTICRMLSYIDGDFLAEIEASEQVISSLGNLLAQVDLHLQEFTNYVLKARQWEWDIQYLHLNKKYLNDITDAHNRSIVNYFIQQHEENILPVAAELRKQIIYNDANEWNILVKNGNVCGIIDFGDLTHSYLINELAVAIVYICYDKKKPLKWANILLKSYHKILPLEKSEIQILYYLIAARLCISLCNSAHSQKVNPGNQYATVSEKSAWSMLHKWLEIGPIAAENSFKRAIGFPISAVSTAKEKIKNRYQYISPIVSLSYKKPISMECAAFQYMYDSYGNTFLDAYNNIPHVGHSHPAVINAGQRQMAKLNTNTRYLYDFLPRYAEKLLSKFPNPLNKVFFVNSGSAASDLAIRLANTHTGLSKTMVMEHGYHGNTQLSIDISAYKFNNAKGQGQKDYIIKTPLPDTFRGNYTKNDGSAGRQYAIEAIETIKKSEGSIAAFISEPIVGCGGQVPLAKGYLKKMYPIIRRQGGVCISDEVQTGFGRLGDHFWGFEMQEVVPDIVILGKPMGNGHPIGAVVCTSEIAKSFEKGVEFFSSFGGNPVSCAIGLSVLEVIEDEKLQQNAKKVGDYYMSLLQDLQKHYSCIGDIRGSGLFIGIDIIKNNNLEPDTKLAQLLKNELRERNILISTDGPYDNVIKTKPPLCFTEQNAELVVENIEEILRIHYKN